MYRGALRRFPKRARRMVGAPGVFGRDPSVASLAASWPGMGGSRAGLAGGVSGKSTIGYKFVSPEYFSVLGIAIVRGRGFAETERSASDAVAVVSEIVATTEFSGAIRTVAPARRSTGSRDLTTLTSRWEAAASTPRPLRRRLPIAIARALRANGPTQGRRWCCRTGQ